MPSSNNFAGRIHGILKTAKAQNGTRKVSEVWCEALEIEFSHKNLIPELGAILVEIRALKQEAPIVNGIDQENYELLFDSLENIFSYPNLSENWTHVSQKINSGLLLALGVLSVSWASELDEEPIDPVSLENLLSDIEELDEELDSDNQDTEQAIMIRQKLNEIRTSIAYYKIWGRRGLKRALESAVGALFYELQKPSNTTNGHAEKATEKVFKFTKILETLEKLLIVAKQGKELVGPFVKGFLNNGS